MLRLRPQPFYFINFIIYYIMAKKTKKIEVETIPPVVKQPKVETLIIETPKPKKEKWEIKDRV